MTEEQKAPSKEEIIQFLDEQIQVKKVQLELQVLNADIAEARARELKALNFIGQMTNPQPPADAVPHTLTQEDIDGDIELQEAGFKAGDEVLIPKEIAAEMKKKLKKK